MSSNSLCEDLADGADRQRLARARLADSAARCARSARPTRPPSLLQVAELVLADLDLVAVGEPVRLDPAPVDVGAVERAEVVDVEAVAAADQQRVVAGDGDVVEEDAGVGAAADADPVLGDA